MPRLMHVNGPSRVGKSTVARRYAAEHPGTLNVDIDLLVGTVDGWRDDFDAALSAARELGAARALAHLRNGGDVVLPQLITSYDASPWAQELAEEAGAEYIEFALLVSRDEHRRRLEAKRPDGEVDAWVQETVSGSDGALLDKIIADLDDYLAGRPATIRIDTGAQTAEETYELLLRALRE
ncbi:AAA family ATPase [Humibacter albus]|uniref:AAA family ATPase n=1 Tax=Humibacter albus TaxID=427754 RepID=UPI0003B44E85|nr:AAA family ATPase [Humibacter albus]